MSKKITIVQKFVPEEIYNELVKENKVLKTRLHELTQENDNLKLEFTLNELRQENEFLKSKVVELEDKYPVVIDFYRTELIKIVQPNDYSEEDLEPFIKYFEV